MGQKEKEESFITPQWITVKEELLNDFFNLSEYFSLWQNNPNDNLNRDRWLNKLRSLYLKCRFKIKNKESFKELSKQMDQYLKRPQRSTFDELINSTLSLCEFIESTGITSVESEALDPLTEFEKAAFPR